MENVKILTRKCILIGLLVIASCMSATYALASTVTFERDYTYQASEIDSKSTCRVNALREVKRLLLEEIGTYLESKTEVKNFQLSNDEITTLTAGIVSAKIITDKWDGSSYYLKAQISADPDEVAKAVKQLSKDTSKSKELEETKKLADKYAKEILRLKEQLTNSTSDDSGLRTTEYKRTVDLLSATNAYNEGIVLINTGKPLKEIISKFDEAIRLNPNYAEAFASRGIYKEVSNPREAIKDFNKALELKPEWSSVYNGLGRAHRNLKEYQKAIESFNEAIRTNDNYDENVMKKKGMLSGIYFNRGLTYEKLGNTEKATEDMKTSASYANKGGPAKSWLQKHGVDWKQ